jgi:hypothetical protein
MAVEDGAFGLVCAFVRTDDLPSLILLFSASI